MVNIVRFNKNAKGDFYAVTFARIEEYFKKTGQSKTGNSKMWLKVAVVLAGLIGSYVSIITLGATSTPIMILSWISLGFWTAMTGLNICHDAIHGALSKNKTVNLIFGHLFNVVGANAYLWKLSHNQAHHSFTNIDGHDEDIKSVPLLRMSPHGPVLSVNKYQHIYAFFMYTLASISWVFIKDYVRFFKKDFAPEGGHPKSEMFQLFFYKAVYYSIYIAIPLIVLPQAWWVVVLGFVAMHMVEGFLLAIIFMLAHVVEEASFPLPDTEGKVENSWAGHQLRTTANFACDSNLAFFICGGLNFQVEHHLFPMICHIHYPAIRKIVKETASEFNLPYLEHPTFFGAIRSHRRLLKRLGSGEKAAATGEVFQAA